MNRQAPNRRGKMARRASLALKLIVSAALIAFVFGRVDTGAIIEIGLRFDRKAAALVLILLLVQLPVLALRWRLITQRLGTEIRAADAIGLTWIGLFFNNFLPGAMGGDMVRAFHLRGFGARWSDALISVAVDRLTALIVLLGLIAAGLPFILRWPLAEPMKIGIASAFGLALVALLGAFLFTLAPIGTGGRLQLVAKPLELARRALSSMLPARVLVLLLTSGLLVHGLTVMVVFAIGVGLAIEASFLDLLIVVPVVILVLAIPISLAGWGLREGTMIVLLNARGTTEAEAVAISVGWGIAILASSLPGVLFWFAARR